MTEKYEGFLLNPGGTPIGIEIIADNWSTNGGMGYTKFSLGGKDVAMYPTQFLVITSIERIVQTKPLKTM